jgi:transcriptional regulator with XRE-family HTH domain
MAANHPLVKYREQHGMTQEALGRELGVTPVTIWRWEHRKRTPRREDAARISEKTGIPTLELLNIAEVAT